MKFNALIKNKWLQDLIALIAGGLLPLAFAPYSLSLLAILSPALLLSVWLTATSRRAFLRGWLFGVGFYTIGVYWIFISVHVYGYAPIPFALLATGLFIVLFALYPAVQGYLLNLFFPQNTWIKCLLVFPASWVLFEWVRSWLFTGFPWLLLGYSQMNFPLRGLAPLFGIYSLSLAVVITSAICVSIFYFKRKQILLLSILVILWLGSWVLTPIKWTSPSGSLFQVSLVQGNIPQEIKWQSSHLLKILNEYQQLTAKHLDSKLIVWPEGAITATNLDAKSYLDYLNALAKKQDATIVAGIPIVIGDQFYNGVLALGNGSGMYLKHHLVPFGEYLPLRSIFEIFRNYVQIPMSDFSRGRLKQPNLDVNGIPVAVFICYEIAYPAEVLAYLPDAQLLITVTDDSWFGDSIASAQHLEMGQMRALETGRYLLFSTNNGITALIDAQGKIINSAPLNTVYVLTGKVQAMSGRTPYVRWGDYPIIVLCFLFLIAGFIKRPGRNG